MIQIIQLILGLLSGLLPLLTKSNAPAEVIQDVQAAIDAISRVHGTVVNKVQVDSLLLTPKW
jgi:hypothetical protein